MEQDLIIENTKIVTLKFEIDQDMSVDTLHEMLCKAIHEQDFDMLIEHADNVADIQEPDMSIISQG